jgi:uncharacterized membrane protein
MEFTMMAGYGDYNWSVILWLFIGIIIFIVVVSIVVRKVNSNRNIYRPGRDAENDVIKERNTRSELTKEDSDEQKKDLLK